MKAGNEPLLRILGVGLSLVAFAAQASEPASHDVTMPTVDGEVVVVEWTGTANPGVSGIANTCAVAAIEDTHDINVTIPDGLYDELSVTALIHIEWDDTAQDLVLTVNDGFTTLGSSDGGTPEENVTLLNPDAETLTAVVCPFLATLPTDYRASLTLTASAGASCVVEGTSAKAHSTVIGAKAAQDPERRGLVNFDRSREEAAQQLTAVPAAGYENRYQSSLFDRNLGLPTFLWAQIDTPTPAVGALANERDLMVERARQHLRAESKKLKLTTAMISEAEAYDAQFNGAGPAVVRFRQKVNGIEVYHRSLNVLLNRSYQPVAVSGYFATDYDVDQVAATRFDYTASEAVAAAWSNLGGTLNAALLSLAETKAGYQWFSVPSLGGSHEFERMPRTKAVYYPRNGALEPAYYVELFSRARVNGQLNAYAFVVSAADGGVLSRNNLTADAAWTYRVFADADDINQPYDMPLGNGYTPFTGSSPIDEIPRVGVPTQLVTLESGPISTGDPWLPDDATDTVGNHVDACLDSVDTPLSGIISNPLNTCTPVLGDLRPSPTSEFTFDYPLTADEDPSGADAQAAAIVNLFYMNNWMHDWWYDHGFNEEAGNAQTDNYGRGGVEGDPIKAQGQDASGRNNANMATPADGSSPTMQQYLFDGPLNGEVRTLTPADSGPLKFTGASFGPSEFDVTGTVVMADEGMGVDGADGCGIADPLATGLISLPALPQLSLAGNIALIDRGNCNFTAKAQFALLSGAIGMVVVNNADGEPITMGNGDIPISTGTSPTDPIYQIPSVMIRKADGDLIKAQLEAGDVTMHLLREESQDVDGTLDNQIIAHEYFHYVHNRLATVTSNQARSMGEGWGDIGAFMLSTRPDDAALPFNDKYQGAYGLAGYVINNFFYGIRRAPYSTDFEKNAFTFKHIADGEPTPDGGPGTSNSEVHNAGEIWANAMWECYAGLLNEPRLTFADAQAKMKDLIVGGLKMTPADATYTEARDAVLAVALATDFDDYAVCSAGFAKRGMGLYAVAPARDSADHVGVAEDYTAFVCKTSGGGASGGDGDDDDGRFGGALGWPLLLPLLGLAGIAARRRTRRETGPMMSR